MAPPSIKSITRDQRRQTPGGNQNLGRVWIYSPLDDIACPPAGFRVGIHNYQ
jgi:hypothetical protein